MEIATILKSLRIGAGLSTIQVAEKLDISDSTYRKYETDKSSATLDVLAEIADIYDKYDKKVIDILQSQPERNVALRCDGEFEKRMNQFLLMRKDN